MAGTTTLPALAHRGVVLVPGLRDWIVSGAPAAWGPLVGAVTMALVRGGPTGLWALLRRGLVVRIGWRWYFVIFLTFPLLVGGATLAAWAVGEPLSATEPMLVPLLIPVGFLYILVLGGPLQEEFGWRGTLLDPPQARLGALWASVCVGAVWAIWHLPLFLFPNDVGPYYDRPFLGTLVTLVLISVLFTWVWNNTGGSVFAVMLFHTMFNLSHWVFPGLENDLAGLLLFALQGGAVLAVVAAFGAARLQTHPG